MPSSDSTVASASSVLSASRQDAASGGSSSNRRFCSSRIATATGALRANAAFRPEQEHRWRSADARKSRKAEVEVLETAVIGRIGDSLCALHPALLRSHAFYGDRDEAFLTLVEQVSWSPQSPLVLVRVDDA